MIQNQNLSYLDLHKLRCDLSGLSVNVGEKSDYAIIKGERLRGHI